MEKVKAVCVDNTYWKDSIIEGPFTIGKIYEISVRINQGWVWVATDYDTMGRYPLKMFKPLDEVRNENLDILLG
jgi:hypothetical protein